jgi:hypothetical protein
MCEAASFVLHARAGAAAAPLRKDMTTTFPWRSRLTVFAVILGLWRRRYYDKFGNYTEYGQQP